MHADRARNPQPRFWMSAGLSEQRGMASLCWKRALYYYITASRLCAPDRPGWARKQTLQHSMRAG